MFQQKHGTFSRLLSSLAYKQPATGICPFQTSFKTRVVMCFLIVFTLHAFVIFRRAIVMTTLFVSFRYIVLYKFECDHGKQQKHKSQMLLLSDTVFFQLCSV